MVTMPITKARKNIYQLLVDLYDTPQPIMLTNRREKKNAVIVSEDLWNEIEEKLAKAGVDLKDCNQKKA